jgi:hypothetical protein
MRTGLLIIAGALLAITPTIALANPLVLKCQNNKGDLITDLTVDLEHNVIIWAYNRYPITGITEEYISAMRPNENNIPPVGGDIFVLNRVSGAFHRAEIGMYYTDVEAGKTPVGPFLDTNVMSGKCTRPML